MTRALMPYRTESCIPDMLAAAGHLNFYFDTDAVAEPELPDRERTEQSSQIASRDTPPRASHDERPLTCGRYQLCAGMLALLARRLSGRRAGKVACKMGHAIVSRVAAILLSQTGEGLHYAALQCRAVCDNDAAARLLSRAVELQHGPAHAELAYMYVGCCSLQKDWHRALEISEKGAKLGCNDCKAALASCLRLMCIDEERAVRMAVESASAGNAWGCSEMGLLLQYAIGMEQNIEEAVFYTRRAAALGNAWARHNLGVMYATGFGVDKDYCEAAWCIMHAALTHCSHC